ncbi:radical SAM protein [Pikeienuella piscinae]|uniref:Radical SAM protein n=1 Tax=Pikeienuella piscinae TaxID=2748098 RepID=A0A7L5BVJ9_9RHOB|nr:radical SAM protein [Pikeienuella piscinae]QIE56390.1 radical SAM protein [Pikeienuella piscinae]
MTCPTAPEGRVRSGFLPDRTVHLHPLRRCNLACRHCYSLSSPRARDILSMEVLTPALRSLYDEGYEVLSLSGGEPMLYPELEALTRYARELGFRIVGITNGFRVTPRFDHLLDCFDGLAVSFDGMGATHDHVRGSPRAFDMAKAALRRLAEIGKPAAAAFTVSRDSLPEIPEFVEMAAAHDVRAVQLRPLVMAGRAPVAYADPALSVADMGRLWLIGRALAAAYEGRLSVHVDLAHARAIVADDAAWRGMLSESARLSDIVNPIVVTPDGVLKPFTFDFPAAFDLGRIEDLTDGGEAGIRVAARPLKGLLAAQLADLRRREEFIDWFAHCRDFAAALGGVVRYSPAAPCR